MKKTKFSLLFATLLCLNLNFNSCSNKDDSDIVSSDIKYSELPSKAQDFIKDYFSEDLLSRIQLINDDGIIIYEVYFIDGTEVAFDKQGDWQEVDAPDGKSIPLEIVPEAIRETLNTQYPGYGVNEINLTGYGYKVDLVSGLELMFNPLGQIIGNDD